VKNATDLQKNLGKDLKDQTFLVEVSYDELCLIKALAQNPHPNYQAEPTTFDQCGGLFHATKDIVSSVQAEHLRNEEGDL
jgi:hypothetical protein